VSELGTGGEKGQDGADLEKYLKVFEQMQADSETRFTFAQFLGILNLPQVAHVNILRGVIGLTRGEALHIAGASDYDELKGLVYQLADGTARALEMSDELAELKRENAELKAAQGRPVEQAELGIWAKTETEESFDALMLQYLATRRAEGRDTYGKGLDWHAPKYRGKWAEMALEEVLDGMQYVHCQHLERQAEMQAEIDLLLEVLEEKEGEGK
jgi:hypothetical protein